MAYTAQQAKAAVQTLIDDEKVTEESLLVPQLQLWNPYQSLDSP